MKEVQLPCARTDAPSWTNDESGAPQGYNEPGSQYGRGIAHGAGAGTGSGNLLEGKRASKKKALEGALLKEYRRILP